MRQYKRRTYFIKKDFQARFILRFVAWGTVWAAATVLLFAFLAMRKVDAMRYSSTVDIDTMSELLLPLTIGVQAFSLIVFAGILAHTIRSLWRRISGPLMKIKTGLAAIAAGDLKHGVALRMNDEFRDLAVDVEGMRLSLREKIVNIKESEAHLATCASDLAAAVAVGRATVSDAVSLQFAVDRMKKDLQAFQL
jgi:methyl-accepting chemotaxis protein